MHLTFAHVHVSALTFKHTQTIQSSTEKLVNQKRLHTSFRLKLYKGGRNRERGGDHDVVEADGAHWRRDCSICANGLARTRRADMHTNIHHAYSHTHATSSVFVSSSHALSFLFSLSLIFYLWCSLTFTTWHAQGRAAPGWADVEADEGG